MRGRVIHVLGHTYRVVEDDSLSASGEWGSTDYAAETITIYEDAQEALKLDILLHEIGHVIVEMSGIRGLLKGGKDLESREEHLVQAYANAFVGILTENPWILQMANRVRAARAKKSLVGEDEP